MGGADGSRSADAATFGSPGDALTLRPTVAADAEEMYRLAEAAYRRYVPRIGRLPAPMSADYASIASSGHAWVAEKHGRLVGLLVLDPRPDHLLLENVAV